MEKKDTFLIDLRKALILNKLIAISAIVIAVAAISVTTIITTNKVEKMLGNVRLIDAKGREYTSSPLDAKTATALQIRAFLLKFVQLAYQYDYNNVESNLKRALVMADGNITIYFNKHKAEGFYKALIELKKIATVDDQEIIQNIQLMDNSFQIYFTQKINDRGTITDHHVSISGNINLVTPVNEDNPNGFLITALKEVYE